MKINYLLLILLCVAQKPVLARSAPWVGGDLNGLRCDGGGQGFGPFDYLSTEDKATNLEIVEKNHFLPVVENLIHGMTSTTPEGDLNYTLRAWPNHHRALLSIIKYQFNIKDKLMPGKLTTPPECYLQRAIHFSPNDTVTYSLYAYYLRKMGLLDKAFSMYEKVMQMEPKNPKFAYSFSLLLIDMKKYDQALENAKIAYASPKTPIGLKRKLEKLGVWKD